MNKNDPASTSEIFIRSQLPATPVRRWTRPFARFLQIESASGIVLLVCTVVALVIANSSWGPAFEGFWETHLRISVGSWAMDESLRHWVNDGLMTIFFFVVGLEIKREMITGELRDPKKAALPIMAALGGMLAPAAIYLFLRGGREGHEGWGIPMATDIAFVVGCMALLGSRVPFGLKILLLSLAIADDIGAIIVIACFYSSDISFVALGLAALGFGLTYFLNRIGVRQIPIYILVGACIWFAFLHSGIHPTIAGVMLGLLTPASAWVGDRALVDILSKALGQLKTEQDGEIEHHHKPLLEGVEIASREAVSPLERLETALHPWVAFGIMPIFALANAGFHVEPASISHPVAIAVAAGLLLGKPIGIVFFSWLAIRIGIARLPSGVNWAVMVGAGFLAGIGFTMSLFVAGLALKGELLDAGKIGTLVGSTLSAMVGLLLLVKFLPRKADQ
jgi:NhaA family Na+:H+ antiporter